MIETKVLSDRPAPDRGCLYWHTCTACIFLVCRNELTRKQFRRMVRTLLIRRLAKDIPNPRLIALGLNVPKSTVYKALH